MSGKEMCANCRYAVRDYAEYFGGGRWWCVDGCKKDLEPTYNDDEEAWECEEYKNDSIRTE